MKNSSKVIMGATLIMVISLAIVLGLILVLLAELYCSLLLRRRQLRLPTTTPDATSTAASTTTTVTTATPTLSNFYAHGVLDAPRNFLFPAVTGKIEKVEESESQHQILDIKMASTSDVTSPAPPVHVGGGGENLVYISNPIYDDELSKINGVETPFETPDTSPSRLETEGSGSGSGSSSGEEEVPITPPLTPMKKLPAQGSSVSLRDARSLETSGSDSNSNNGISSSPSDSPCTSPSW